MEENNKNDEEKGEKEISMKEVDFNNLTMELLVNKSQYNKILGKVNPAKFKERQEYYRKIRQYETEIISLFETLMEHPEKGITRDINESFDVFIKTCIKHLVIKKQPTSYSANDDDEVMFGTIDEPIISSKSFWGEQIKKTGN